MKIKLTNKEYIELKCAYYSGFKYIARHKKGTLSLFKEKPVRDKKVNGSTIDGYDTWIVEGRHIKDHILYDEVKLGEYKFITWQNGFWKITDILNSVK